MLTILLLFWMVQIVVLSLLNQFSKFSGLKPNIEKTRCIRLGSKRHSKGALCEDLSLLWSDEQFTFLGIIISVDLQQIPEFNYKKKNNIKKLIGQWLKRLISPLGENSYKINIDIHNNTFVHILTKPKRTKTWKWFQFLWNKNTDKVASNTNLFRWWNYYVACEIVLEVYENIMDEAITFL